MNRLALLFLLALASTALGCGNTGIVCSSTEVRCGNTCANFQTSPDHCGACGNACPTGFVCQSGQCACPSDLTACGQSCVNLTNSVGNCGKCGTTCPAGQVCEGSGCRGSCDAGISCGGSCADTASDSQNCGGCAGSGGVACPQGQGCVNGACASDLYAACYNSGEIFALDARGEVASPTKAVAPPSNPAGLAFHGHGELEVVDGIANALYSFDVSSGFGAPTSFALGAGPNAVAVSGDTLAVTNSLDNTLDVLTRASPGWQRRCGADAGSCAASVSFGPGTLPEFVAFGPDAMYVTLQGNTFGTDNPDTAGNKVVRVGLADLSQQPTSLNGLDLQAPDAGTQARPQGVAYANGQVFVALANLAGYTAGAPGLVEVLDEPSDGGALIPHGQPIALGAGCINPGAVLISGTRLFVACGPAFDPNPPYGLLQPGAIAALDTTTLQPAFAPSVLSCPANATGCAPGAASRLAFAGGKLFAGDVSNGRLFVADPDSGALERGPDQALVLCPAPDGGFNFISDVAARP